MLTDGFARERARTSSGLLIRHLFLTLIGIACIELICRFGIPVPPPPILSIFVKDNGMGIPKEYHQRIFNLFERLPDAKKCSPKGTGVGLAIVKKIVESVGGKISVESTPGQGATFYFTLVKETIGIDPVTDKS